MTRRAHAALASLAVLLIASCGSSAETLRSSAATGEREVAACEGHTIGFWANKNGQALIEQADVAALAADFMLRGAENAEFNPTSAADLVAFLRGANAKDMANMLSAQWVAFFLGARHTVCEDAAFYFPGFALEDDDVVSFEALSDEVAAALDETPATRERMEVLKNFLVGVNEGGEACVCPPMTGATGATGAGSNY